MRYLLAFFLGTATLSSSSPGQTKTFLREYTYDAGEADSKITSRAIALDQVKRLLLEEVGVYIHSQFEVEKWEKIVGTTSQYAESAKVEIQAITAGITETKVLEERWTGEKYYIRAEIAIDIADVERNVRAITEGQDALAELAESRRTADEARKEIERLKAELSKTKSESEKSTLKAKYAEEVMNLSYSDLFERAFVAAVNGDLQTAVALCTRAIEMNPRDPRPYVDRALARAMLRDHEGTITDLLKAIELNPLMIRRPNWRKSPRRTQLGKSEKLLTGEPEGASAYTSRGLFKVILLKHEAAIPDFNKAIQLDPKNADALAGRGYARSRLSNPNHPQNLRVSLKDYDRAIMLKPDFAWAYFIRGNAKGKLGDKQGALADLQKAKELGVDVPQQLLESHK